MAERTRLADFTHPAIQKTASKLTEGIEDTRRKIEKIFEFVRDDIPFGFTPTWNELKASEVMACGVGYCNTKATLFLALCQASGVTARVHFGLIDIRIMYGILPSLSFRFMPKTGSHSWIEVRLGDGWRPVDSYINDKGFYERAIQRLEKSGRPLGYSVSFIDGKSSCDFNFGDKGFVHMGAVVEDHGVWEDPADYFASDRYSRFNAVQTAGYPVLAALSNRNVDAIRSGR